MWELDPWGERRADWRQAASIMFYGKMLGGGEGEAPNPTWPYWTSNEIDVEKMLASAETFDSMLEPKPGGGYRMKGSTDGNDNRPN